MCIRDRYKTTYQQIYNWVKKYQEQGETGLLDRQGRRRPCLLYTSSANMRCDVRQLFPIELVVARTDVIEVVFPVHCNGWVSVLVKKEKTAFTVNHRLVLGTRPIFNNAPETHIHIIRCV